MWRNKKKKHQDPEKPSYESICSAVSSQYGRDPLPLLAQRNVSLQQHIVSKGKIRTENNTVSTSCVKDILRMSTRVKN